MLMISTMLVRLLTLLACPFEQVTLIVTNAIDRLFTKNPRYDGRSLLGGLRYTNSSLALRAVALQTLCFNAPRSFTQCLNVQLKHPPGLQSARGRCCGRWLLSWRCRRGACCLRSRPPRCLRPCARPPCMP